MRLLIFFKYVLLSKYLAVTLQRKVFQQCRLRADRIGIVVTVLGQGQNFPKNGYHLWTAPHIRKTYTLM